MGTLGTTQFPTLLSAKDKTVWTRNAVARAGCLTQREHDPNLASVPISSGQRLPRET